jgi:putative flippase GtrA
VIVPRYLVVGGLCALLNVAVLTGGEALHLPLAVSVAASFAVVCIVGYRLHAAVTFGAPASGQGFARYVLAMAAGLPASAVLLWLFARALGWPMPVAATVATVATLVLNFLSSRWAILTPPRSRSAGVSS